MAITPSPVGRYTGNCGASHARARGVQIYPADRWAKDLITGCAETNIRHRPA